jgi:hypothetical protein
LISGDYPGLDLLSDSERGVMGTFHKVGKKYLHPYVAQFQFRYNNPHNSDIFGTAIEGMLKRLANAAAIAAFACLILGFVSVEALQRPHSTTHSVSTSKKENSAGTRAEEEKPEAATARYTKWLTVFTGILAFATIGLGIATLGLYLTGEKQIAVAKESADAAKLNAESAKKSVEAAVLSQRPWLSFEAEIHGPGIVYHENGMVSVNFRVGLEVSGNSPATDVTVICRWFEEASPFYIQEVMVRRLVEFAPQDHRSGFAPFIFPGDSRDPTIGTAAAALADLQFEFPGGRKILASMILIAIFYRFAFSDERHKTAKLYSLSRKHPLRPGASSVVFVEEGNLGTDLLRLTTLGHYAD